MLINSIAQPLKQKDIKKHCFFLYVTVYSSTDQRDELRSADEL